MIRDLNFRRQWQDLFPTLFKDISENAHKYNEENRIADQMITKNITFVVTESCNLACSYCYECNKDHKKVMTKETAMKAIDMILDDNKMEGYINSNSNPSVIIEFIGGEPLLQIELLDFICDYFRYKTFELNHPWYKYHMFNITTNGILYNTPEVIKFFDKNKGRLSVTITIDGDKELHDSCRVFPDGSGSYDIVYDAVIDAKTRFDMKSSKITLAPENIMHTAKAIKHLYNMGLTDLNANVVYENVWIPERDAPIFYDQLIQLADWILENKIYEAAFCSLFDETIGRAMLESENQNWCGGNGQMLSIGTDGRLFPCIRFMKYSLSNSTLEEFEIGNVDKGIDKEEDNKFLKCLSCIDRRSQSTDECWNCSVASGCAWCTGYNYDYFGDPNKRATFICELHKARVLGNYYYWNKLYKKENLNKKFELNLTKEDIEFITKGDKRWQNI